MKSHAQKMVEGFQEHERKFFCFLTTMSNPDAGISVEMEPYHALLKRPRIVVTCPLGSGAVFTRRGWDGALYEAWWVKNGRYLVKVGSLNEC